MAQQCLSQREAWPTVKVGLGGGDELVTEMWLGLSPRERPLTPTSPPTAAPTASTGSGLRLREDISPGGPAMVRLHLRAATASATDPAPPHGTTEGISDRTGLRD